MWFAFGSWQLASEREDNAYCLEMICLSKMLINSSLWRFKYFTCVLPIGTQLNRRFALFSINMFLLLTSFFLCFWKNEKEQNYIEFWNAVRTSPVVSSYLIVYSKTWNKFHLFFFSWTGYEDYDRQLMCMKEKYLLPETKNNFKFFNVCWKN